MRFRVRLPNMQSTSQVLVASSHIPTAQGRVAMQLQTLYNICRSHSVP